MFEKTIYICETCGKIFEDHDSCNLHEMQEMAARYEGGFKLYDKLGEVKFNPKADPSPLIAIFYYGGKEAAELLERYFISFGYDAPPFMPGEENIWVFNERTHDWCEVDDIIQLLQGLF